MKLLFIFLLTLVSSIQINQAITSGDTEAPTPTPTTVDFITIMSKQGCKAFTEILKLSKALHTYKDNINNGLTTFCPSDAAVNRFAAEYNNLTDAEKVNLLLYHSVPVYLSLEILKSNNGFMNTLANEFEFAAENRGEDVVLETRVNTASIERVLVDQVPFVVYEISEVLIPGEFVNGKYYSGAADAPVADAPEADDEDEKVDDGIDNRVNGILMGFLRLFKGLHA